MVTPKPNTPNITAKAGHIWRQPLACIVVLTAVLLAVFWSAFSDMVRVWGSSPTYNHGFLILPISAFLLWQRRHLLEQAGPGLTPWGLVPVIFGLGVMGTGIKLDIQLFQHAALVILLVSSSITLIGVDRARLIAFPLFFLLFMVPFGEELVPYLQEITAWFIVTVVSLLNIPIYQDGMYLMGPTGDFEVAAACAGLRFLVATIMVAVLFAQLSFASWRKKLIFLVLALVTPIIANAIRATLIVLIATWSGHKYAVGFDHLVYGWGFFAIIIGGLLLAGNRYADSIIPAPTLPEKLSLVVPPRPRLWITLILVALFVATKTIL